MALSRLPDETRRILERLTTLEVPHAIVGGLAVSARTEPRFTRDVDVAAAVGDDLAVEALVRSLRDAGYAPAAIVEQESAGRIASVRLLRPEVGVTGPVIDLLFASSGIEAEVVASAEALELFDGIMAPVARVPALIALKLLARDDRTRPQDAVDLVALASVATATDLDETARLCGLIEQRGYARGRDLRRAVGDLVRAQA